MKGESNPSTKTAEVLNEFVYPLLTPSLHYHPGILVLKTKQRRRGRQEDLDSWGARDLGSRVDHRVLR